MDVTTSHVLVPLDGSPLADEALTHALETFDCRITVLNVITPIDGTMSEGSKLGIDQERRESAHKRADELIESARERADSFDQSIETGVETGEPAETILGFVGDNDVDHIVMGSHGGSSGALTRRLLGTVTTAVVGEAPFPVTIVR